eukprot:CAMPEP_0194044532 /NCGR_PEP_ID=MMETSP0009_2-20130614/15985_1 /TAXON_ID=210454 /ORGANISM="Grammatophora oceanica, Strain CCMP 410" /LENGTH=42 /DNA_ID= /DNA_START= /DNA_END= /DNA_ORIENTATION=
MAPPKPIPSEVSSLFVSNFTAPLVEPSPMPDGFKLTEGAGVA